MAENILVLGGGAGGLELVGRLARLVCLALYRMHQAAVQKRQLPRCSGQVSGETHR